MCANVFVGFDSRVALVGEDAHEALAVDRVHRAVHELHRVLSHKRVAAVAVIG